MSEESEISVERSVEVDASPEEVWNHVVDGSLASEWMASPTAIDPRVGGKVDFAPGGVEHIGTVEEVDPGRSITWSWRHPERDPSQVTITIKPLDGGSRVTVTERLLPFRITDARDGQAGFESPHFRTSVLLAA